jgi:hypothetical protein
MYAIVVMTGLLGVVVNIACHALRGPRLGLPT